MSEIKFIMGGREISLIHLGRDIDKMFFNLHAAYFSNRPIDLAELETATIKFFNIHPNLSFIHNEYFQNFTIIWKHFLSMHNYLEAEHIWEIALKPVLKWEKQHPNNRIHKGTAYYFWGMTTLEHGDLDKGYALMHQAVEEDVLTSGNPFPNTPASAFATLDYEKVEQTYRQWVIKQGQFVIERLNNYAKHYSRKFNINNFRNKFLLSPPSVDIIFIFTFALARLIRMSTFPTHITQSRFAGQLQANILFDMILVIDTIIRVKNIKKWRFIDHAEFLLKQIGQPLSNKELRDINEEFNTDFNKALDDAINGTLALPNGKKLTGLQSDVAVVYGLRNHEAHDISSVTTVWKKYEELLQIVMNIIFASVDFLY